MTPFHEFYDHLMPELPGITTPLVDLHLREVAREFCRRTTIWRVQFDPVTTIGGQATYDLEPSEAQCDVVKLHKVTLNDQLLYNDLWTPGDEGDKPKYDKAHPPFVLDDTLCTITLAEAEVPTASVALGLDVTGSLMPKYNAMQLPDLFKSQHREALRVGTLARLMAMGKKPWTDRDMALDHRNTFTSLAVHAAYQAAAGNTRKPLRARTYG